MNLPWQPQFKPIVAVIALDDAKQAVPLAEALVAGGVGALEITLRTPAGLPAIEAIARQVPNAVVGVGTVTTLQQLQDAHQAGATFAVSPGVNTAMIEWAIEQNLPIYPGVMTPTDIITCINLGLDTLKFFPAEQAGGIHFLKALAGPFPGIRFIPTGGINAGNYKDYLALPNVAAIGGSWLTEPRLLNNAAWDEIEMMAHMLTA